MVETCGYKVSEVGFAYDGHQALAGVNLDLAPGRFYGLVGPNGCGKTTFLDLLTGNKAPDSGTVVYNNCPVVDFHRRDLARQVALVPQDFGIGFAFTVEEAEGAPEEVTLDSGIKVQSVPGQDEKPQIFETVEQIEARPEWNAIGAQTSIPWVPGFSDKELNTVIL